MDTDQIAILAKDNEREFERILKIFKPLSNKMCAKWSKSIPRDEAEQCIRIGIWEAVKKYTGKSYFFPLNEIRKEMLKYWKQEIKQKSINGNQIQFYGHEFTEDKFEYNEPTSRKQEVIDLVKDKFPEDQMKRYILWLDDLSLREIGKKCGVSHEAVRKTVCKINKYLTLKLNSRL